MARKRSEKPTMNDVAAAAGCSQTTVSLVLNNVPGHGIPDETRRRVAEATVALGYGRPAPVLHETPARRTDAPARVAGTPPPPRQAPTATSFTDKVARMIAVDILSGRIPEGSPLPPDADLLTKFGVSRTVLREAMRGLISKGLVEAKAGVGTKVRERHRWHLFDPDVLIWQAEAGLDRQFIKHLGEMRLILEPEAAALAAQRGSRADVDHLIALADRMAANNIQVDAFAKADLDFHFAVSACADNPFLTAVNALIEVSLTASLRRSWPGDVPGGKAHSAEAHRQIALAIGAGDCDGAREAMRRVIIEGMTRSLGNE